MGLAAAMALWFWLERSGASRGWRVTALPLLWMGMTGVLQARARTCIALAARGVCDPDAGQTSLTEAEDRALRQRARTIVRTATALALAMTALAVLYP